jgi:hypothetical protein
MFLPWVDMDIFERVEAMCENKVVFTAIVGMLKKLMSNFSAISVGPAIFMKHTIGDLDAMPARRQIDVALHEVTHSIDAWYNKPSKKFLWYITQYFGDFGMRAYYEANAIGSELQLSNYLADGKAGTVAIYRTRFDSYILDLQSVEFGLRHLESINESEIRTHPTKTAIEWMEQNGIIK